jgi:hypothetical protein
MMVRSNSANTPSIWNIVLPAGVVVQPKALTRVVGCVRFGSLGQPTEQQRRSS